MPDQQKLLAVIDAYSETAHGSQTDGGELSRQRALALDAFAGKNIEPAPEGRSQVVDYTVFETVQWIMPSLMRIFAGGDNIVEFEPFGPEDEEGSEQESDYLNYLVTQKGDWDLTVREWCQDALLTKNAYCLVTMEEKLRPELERYEKQSEEQVSMIVEDGVEIVGQQQYNDPDDEGTVVNPMTNTPVQSEEELVEAIAYYTQNGLEPQLSYRQMFDIEVRKVTPVKNLCFKVLAPERCKVANDTTNFTLEDCNYFEYWDIATISELRKLGYDVPDELGDETYYDLSEEDAARDEIFQSDLKTDIPDPASKQVMARWIWVRHDYDEDGIAELQHVVRVGELILEREEVSRIPVASIVPFINTHRHIGMSIADLTFDIQRIKTALLRNFLDAINLSSNPRHYVNVSANVNLDDLLVSRPGGVVRGSAPYMEAMGILQTENTAPYAQQGLDYMERVAEGRSGVSRNFAGIDVASMTSDNAYNKIGQLSTMAAQRVEDIARLFGTGFKRLFSIAHELVIKSGHSQEAVKLRGQWINIDPTTWRTGRDMRITAPFAAGNKDALLQRLMVVASIQERAAAMGVPIVDADNAYNLAIEIAKAADLPGDKFFTDPATQEPQPEQPDPTMVALEIENKKAEYEAADEERQAELDRYKTDISAEIDKYRADLQSQTQLALAQIKAGQAVDLEKFRADLAAAPTVEKVAGETADRLNAEVERAIGTVADALQELKELQTAEREVVREGGKVVGVRINGQFKPVQRDESGKITRV